ncbi:MAG: amidohydrolase family protein [Rhodospirillaceae bacterium]|jgi:5-methylthioadenosine/S-adenosylhomocysteine deaminase|nr:amidohydrolase family protein [Rhodospirillaceae bacterium]MBT5456762.1 amidohydrolase family protein [Rhodospirillaceae bacterium]
MNAAQNKLLVKGGRVYDHDGNVHQPATADILIEGDSIAAIGSNLTAEQTAGAEILDASNHLVVPGMMNAHYHSHDTLCRGLFEESTLEMWLLYTLPLQGNRSKEEVRLRTLVGALESMRCGVTTVQDMLGLIPLQEDYVDVVLDAYEEIGERVVFSPMVFDVPAVAMVRDRDTLPPEVQEMMGTKAGTATEQIDLLEAQIKRRPAGGTTHWACGPFAPQRCSLDLLAGCADFAERHDLGIYTHMYETRGQAVIARERYGDYGGSFVGYVAEAGMLNHRFNIAHSVWITRDEIDRMADANAGVVINHNSNFKLKSGIAPNKDLLESGVRIALGCDNCSGSDVQNMFQSMKTFCQVTAISEPELGPHITHDAVRFATQGSARSACMDDVIGALKPGYKADMMLLDLNDTAYLPFNSAARQLVYTETGRSIDNVIIGGKIVVKDRKVTTIDEDALRAEVADYMKGFIADHEDIVKARASAVPYMLEAHKRVWDTDVGMNRFMERAPRK